MMRRIIIAGAGVLVLGLAGFFALGQMNDRPDNMDHGQHDQHAMNAVPGETSHDVKSYRVSGGTFDAVNRKLAKSMGIEIEGVRLTGAETMIDFRYKILDAEKAAGLHGEHIRPHLVDEKTSMRFEVPFASKVGSLRQSAKAPVEGRTYVILFANPGRTIKSGDKVTIEQADLRITGIPVS